MSDLPAHPWVEQVLYKHAWVKPGCQYKSVYQVVEIRSIEALTGFRGSRCGFISISQTSSRLNICKHFYPLTFFQVVTLWLDNMVPQYRQVWLVSDPGSSTMTASRTHAVLRIFLWSDGSHVSTSSASVLTLLFPKPFKAAITHCIHFGGSTLKCLENLRHECINGMDQCRSIYMSHACD